MGHPRELGTDADARRRHAGGKHVGLCATPGGAGPLLAAASATPGRTDSRGLGYVWDRHVVQRQPVHLGFLGAAFGIYVAATW